MSKATQQPHCCTAEWRIPVSSRLTTRDLTVLAATCRSLGCRVVAFAYRGAVGKPLPEVPTREQLAQIAQAAGLIRVLARLDLDDITDVAVFPKFMTSARARFDFFSILLTSSDPLLFERLNVAALVAQYCPLSDSCSLPLVVNVDACLHSPIVLPRKHLPAGAVVEISYSLLFGTNSNETIVKSLMKGQLLPKQAQEQGSANQQQQQQQPLCSIGNQVAIRTLLPQFKHIGVLLSCGGDVLNQTNEVDAALLCRLRGSVDAACLAEVICGRNDLLETNRKLARRLLSAMQRAVEVKLVQSLANVRNNNRNNARAASSTKPAQQQQEQQKKQQQPPVLVTEVPAPSNEVLKSAAAFDSKSLAKLLRAQFIAQRKRQLAVAATANKPVRKPKRRPRTESKPRSSSKRRSNSKAKAAASAAPKQQPQQQPQQAEAADPGHFGWSEE